MSVAAVVPRTSLPLAPEVKLEEKKDLPIDEVAVVPDEQLLEEVIPDDLSEFSDEADEILNRQEVSNFPSTFLEKHILSDSSCCFFLKISFLYFHAALLNPITNTPGSAGG